MSAAPPTFLIGQHPTRGRLWAAIAEAHHTEPAVAETRFGGYVRPFQTEDDARTALELAGAENIEIERRPKRGRRG